MLSFPFFVGALMLSDIIASVILFQKQVQYHEETGKRALLENMLPVLSGG